MSASDQHNVVSLRRSVERCHNCRLKPLCLARELSSAEAGQLDSILKHERSLERGEYLFRQGSAFQAVYTVRSGSLKTCASTEDGHEQITGFHLPGMFVGLDAIATGEHPGSGIALETATVCEIPYERLSKLSATIPGLQTQLVRIMSQQIFKDENHAVLLGKKGAQARLATLLVDMAKQLKERGYSACEFNLHMSRRDIANYLGLALETVSRSFTRLQQIGLISVDRHNVQIHDLELLRDRALEPEDRQPTRGAICGGVLADVAQAHVG